MSERKLTHLLRCCKILKSSCTVVHSGFRISCALHMGNFSSTHGVLGQTLAMLLTSYKKEYSGQSAILNSNPCNSSPKPNIINILKYLPKTNCRKCKSPTCMVFAARVAEGAFSGDNCPELMPEIKEQLNEYPKRSEARNPVTTPKFSCFL